MFVVIFSKRASGKVSRKYFEYKSEAEEYVKALEAKILRPSRKIGKYPTLRNHRIEIKFIEEDEFIWR